MKRKTLEPPCPLACPKAREQRKPSPTFATGGFYE